MGLIMPKGVYKRTKYHRERISKGQAYEIENKEDWLITKGVTNG